MAQKIGELEFVIKKEFSKLSFYNKKGDSLKVINDEEDKTCRIEYYANIKADKNKYYDSYFQCDIELDMAEKAASWNYIWLSEECRGKGWGGEVIRKGESIFKKLGIKTAYVCNNINKPFWTRMGYPASFKAIKKSSKNFYKTAYDHISSMSFYSGNDISILRNSNGVYDLSYTSSSKNSTMEVRLDLLIDLKEKKASWNYLSAPERKHKEVINKCEKMLSDMGIKKVSVEPYYSSENEMWEEFGYEKSEDRIYKNF